VAAGPVTLVPLVCFNAATRHLPYTTIGFLQYLAPTLVLLQAVLLFGEHLSSSTLVAFIFIWAGLAIYSVDAVISLRRRS
jgi:chloramphenicol-sensitive protein RarD